MEVGGLGGATGPLHDTPNGCPLSVTCKLLLLVVAVHVCEWEESQFCNFQK